MSNSIILVEDRIRWKRGFEIFLTDHWAGNIGNKNIAGKYQNILVTHPILTGSVHTVCYVYNSLVHIIYVLFIFTKLKSVCLKVTILFYFCHSKNASNIMKNIFNSISIYSWKKTFLLTNIRNKCVIKKIFIFWQIFFFQIFSSKVYYFQYDNRYHFTILVEKQGTLERARRYVCKNLLNLDYQDSIRYDISQVTYKWRITWKELFLSPSHFLQNVLIKTSDVCFKKLLNFLSCICHFLISRSLDNSEHIKRYILLYLTITNRGGICILKACL